VALSLKPTNILVNDPHYRKVAALWRSWVKFGHKRQETAEQRAPADSAKLRPGIDSCSTSWCAASRRWDGRRRPAEKGWALVEERLVAACGRNGRERACPRDRQAHAAPAAQSAPTSRGPTPTSFSQVEHLDGSDGEVVIAHVGARHAHRRRPRLRLEHRGPRGPLPVLAVGHRLRGAHGPAAPRLAQPRRRPAYPVATTLRALPEWPGRRDWLRHEGEHLVAFRAPTERELPRPEPGQTARPASSTLAQRAKAAKQAFAVAPREAVTAFEKFVDLAVDALVGLDTCPVCGAKGIVTPRPGKSADGSDATWWAECSSCSSEWGTRPCTGCGVRYRALVPQTGLVAAAADAIPPHDWPDKVFGRDLWAQPCSTGVAKLFRCPNCGACSSGSCARCRAR
jgi:hypothetical protein